jgi:hypothetical protein
MLLPGDDRRQKIFAPNGDYYNALNCTVEERNLQVIEKVS